MRNLTIGLSTILIASTIPFVAVAQRIDCYKRGNVIQCPGYGNFSYLNNSNQASTDSAIRALYLQVLGRNVDSNGLRDYTNAVRTNRLSLAQVRYELVNSAEAGQSIQRIYQQSYGRNLNATQMQSARLVLLNGSSLEQLRQQYISTNGNYNNNSNDDQKPAIRVVYQQVLGRDPDNGGLGYYSNALQNDRLSMVQIRRELAVSAESDRNISRIYQQILGREPNSNEFRNSRQILVNANGSLDQLHNSLEDTSESQSRNGDRNFVLQDLLGIFK